MDGQPKKKGGKQDKGFTPHQFKSRLSEKITNKKRACSTSLGEG
jgi:hypothetical protein